MNTIEIICLESDAYYKLLDDVLSRLKINEKNNQIDQWISGAEAMKMLRIKSKTTLQKMRDEGRIRYSQPEKRIILYDSKSILDYLEDFVYEPFKMKR
ncbi:MAG: helix-turn-helix domain-containing protein [Mucilaginibacter sp.]